MDVKAIIQGLKGRLTLYRILGACRKGGAPLTNALAFVKANPLTLQGSVRRQLRIEMATFREKIGGLDEAVFSDVCAIVQWYVGSVKGIGAPLSDAWCKVFRLLQVRRMFLCF